MPPPAIAVIHWHHRLLHHLDYTFFLCFQSTRLLNQRSPVFTGSLLPQLTRAPYSGVLASVTKLSSLAFITSKAPVCFDMQSARRYTRRSTSDLDAPPDPDSDDGGVDVEGGVAE